ncbi:MAG: hypothetical protein CMN17_12525 [Roseovarius sp.]|nr:hypothetical protein [Roseovarius sp.]MBK44775.1 hypothetical protein [Roseovarius sp.]
MAERAKMRALGVSPRVQFSRGKRPDHCLSCQGGMAQDRRPCRLEMRSENGPCFVIKMPEGVAEQDKLRMAEQETRQRKGTALGGRQTAPALGQRAVKTVDPVHQPGKTGAQRRLLQRVI